MLVTMEQFGKVCSNCPFFYLLAKNRKSLISKMPYLSSDDPVFVDCFETICGKYLLSLDANENARMTWRLWTGSDVSFEEMWDKVMHGGKKGTIRKGG